MNNLENKKFYDIRKNHLSEIAGAFLEEGTVSDLRKRINISDLYPESRIEKDYWEYNEHSEEEREATLNVFDLGKKGYNLIIWISPDDGGKVYKEGRLNIEFPVFGENEWSIYGRHVPLLCNQKESFELATRLLKNNGVSIEKISDVESVRRQPIGFRMEKAEDWLGECKKLMPEFLEIWDFIENGGDVENKLKMEKDVKIAMKKAGGNNYLFESIMLMMGNRINAEGGHGSSWNSLNNSRGIVASLSLDGKVSYKLGVTEGLKHCEKCGCYYSGDKCPLCD